MITTDAKQLRWATQQILLDNLRNLRDYSIKNTLEYYTLIILYSLKSLILIAASEIVITIHIFEQVNITLLANSFIE